MDDGGGLAGIVSLVFFLAILVFFVAAAWRLYEKAGRAGWEAIVPIYNLYVMTVIVGMPAWSIILFFIPLLNIAASIWMAVNLAKSFGKDILFAIGLLLLGFIFYPLLAFGDAEYIGPA